MTPTKFSDQKLVIFDMIGTLTTERHLVSVIMKEVLPMFKSEKLKKYYEKYKVDEISNKEFWSKLEIGNCYEIEKRILEKVVLREEVPKLLEDLKTKYKLAILSNIPKEWGEFVAEKYGFNTYFEQTIFSGACGLKKPNREIYELLLGKFPSIAPGNVYYIDDSLGDLETGKKCLMRTVWLKSDLDKSRYIPDHTIERLSELKLVLNK